MVKSVLVNPVYTHPLLVSPTRIVKLLAVMSMLVVMPGLAVGCADSSNSRQPVQYFPVQKEPAQAVLLSLVSGKLVVDNGYLRVSGDLIIWPYGYSWKTEKKEIWILDDRGEKVMRVGDSVRIGGGEIPASFAEEKMGQKLPAGVKGPFWLMGEIVTE